MLYDGIHEPIVSEADWHLAKQKRANNGGKKEKTHSLEHEHILSGLLCCPICGAGMYGNVNRKRGPDGKSYRTISITSASTAKKSMVIRAPTANNGVKISSTMQW